MGSREDYAPGAASGAEIRKDGENWTLVLVRELPHPPGTVWAALTDPAQLRELAPYDADRNLGTVGTATLTTVGALAPHVTETRVKQADAPKVLQFNWGSGGQDLRWELEPVGSGGTRLTLWHHIDRRFIAMGAAGWHICFDVLDRFLGGHPIGRIAGQGHNPPMRLANLAVSGGAQGACLGLSATTSGFCELHRPATGSASR